MENNPLLACSLILSLLLIGAVIGNGWVSPTTGSYAPWSFLLSTVAAAYVELIVDRILAAFMMARFAESQLLLSHSIFSTNPLENRVPFSTTLIE